MSYRLEPGSYHSYRGLPPLAGLASFQRAAQANWGVDESVTRWKRLHYILKRLQEIFTSRITSEPIYELKMAFSHHAYLCAEQVNLIRQRVSEMREPPLGLDKIPHPGLERLMDEVSSSPDTASLVLGCYEVVLPALITACQQLQLDAHPLADAPSVRAAKLIVFELSEVQDYGNQAIQCLIQPCDRKSHASWLTLLHQCLDAAGKLDGTHSTPQNSTPQNSTPQNSTQQSSPEPTTLPAVPPPLYSAEPYPYQAQPQRDERFIDPYNAGVNPEAFLYDERFPPRAKTLMMYYKRLREIDVPEMMASILAELRDQEPWPFHMEMVRQLWDEARHAMMGEVGFVSSGIDWRKIPINFTWSRNLNLQLDARERHGVLFFIEQGLMPRTGKRYEWEVGLASGDPLSGLFQDFDWADEVLHAQIGRRWYVPRYKSLNEALAYGDRCWTKVLSHWRDYRDCGLTEHRNWWPDLYRDACALWGIEPDPQAAAFHQTYEDSRADLQKLS